MEEVDFTVNEKTSYLTKNDISPIDEVLYSLRWAILLIFSGIASLWTSIQLEGVIGFILTATFILSIPLSIAAIICAMGKVIPSIHEKYSGMIVEYFNVLQILKKYTKRGSQCEEEILQCLKLLKYAWIEQLLINSLHPANKSMYSTQTDLEDKCIQERNKLCTEVERRIVLLKSFNI